MHVDTSNLDMLKDIIGDELKGSAANIGANQLSAMSAEMEQKAKQSDMDGLPELLSKIETESKAVDLALVDYIKTF